jgi:DNA-binding MarR family transcriptional regulator
MRDPLAQREGVTIAHVDGTCSVAIRGRRAARVVAEWAKRFGLTEAELQLLWRLRTAPDAGLDQTTLADALAFSPAQISASVERLRSRGLICATTSSDRRRRYWQLSAAGRELLEQIARVVMSQHCQTEGELSAYASGANDREAAA